MRTRARDAYSTCTYFALQLQHICKINIAKLHKNCSKIAFFCTFLANYKKMYYLCIVLTKNVQQKNEIRK